MLDIFDDENLEFKGRSFCSLILSRMDSSSVFIDDRWFSKVFTSPDLLP